MVHGQNAGGAGSMLHCADGRPSKIVLLFLEVVNEQAGKARLISQGLRYGNRCTSVAYAGLHVEGNLSRVGLAWFNCWWLAPVADVAFRCVVH